MLSIFGTMLGQPIDPFQRDVRARPTSLIAALAAMVPNVPICATDFGAILSRT